MGKAETRPNEEASGIQKVSGGHKGRPRVRTLFFLKDTHTEIIAGMAPEELRTLDLPRCGLLPLPLRPTRMGVLGSLFPGIEVALWGASEVAHFVLP